jgi:hypothetical protein
VRGIVEARLHVASLEARRHSRKEPYFADRDGLRVQLQDARYNGGGGPLGDRIAK